MSAPEIIALPDELAWGALLDKLGRKRSRVSVLASVLEYCRSVLDAKCVVLEQDYVDRDYRDEFSNIYSKCFRSYGDRAVRVHFFDRVLEGLDEVVDGDPAYLGFAVLRPVEVGVVGRTVLVPPDGKLGIRSYTLCCARFEVHLYGRTLSVEGVPFIEQDRMSMSCAQASIWMALRYLSQSSNGEPRLPYQISDSATRYQPDMPRTVPATGLTMKAMVQGIKNLGYGALLEVRPATVSSDALASMAGFGDDEAGNSESKTRTPPPTRREAILAADWLRRWDPVFRTYTYVESRMPVLLMFKGNHDFHAMTVVGHCRQERITEPRLAGLRAQMTHAPMVEVLDAGEPEEKGGWIAQLTSMSANLVGAHEYVDAFVVHDDQAGPYRLLPASAPMRDLLSRSSTAPLLVDARYGDVLEAAKGLVVPLPEKLYLESQFAYQQWFATFVSPVLLDYLKRLAKAHENAGRLVEAIATGTVVARLLFVKSSSYKSWVREEGEAAELSPQVRDVYLSQAMPTYIWLLEFSTDELYANGQELILGEYILDSTASALDPEPFIVAHLPHMIVKYDREEPVARPPVPVAVYDDSPHRCYRRPTS